MDSSEGNRAGANGAKRSALFRAARDGIEPIPKPLGFKRSALQARKHRRAILESHISLLQPSEVNDADVLASADGRTVFAISRATTALVIERRYCPREGLRISQLMLFDDETMFDRWCDNDPIRLEDPLLADQVRRRGHEFFAVHR